MYLDNIYNIHFSFQTGSIIPIIMLNFRLFAFSFPSREWKMNMFIVVFRLDFYCHMCKQLVSEVNMCESRQVNPVNFNRLDVCHAYLARCLCHYELYHLSWQIFTLQFVVMHKPSGWVMRHLV